MTYAVDPSASSSSAGLDHPNVVLRPFGRKDQSPRTTPRARRAINTVCSSCTQTWSAPTTGCCSTAPPGIRPRRQLLVQAVIGAKISSSSRPMSTTAAPSRTPRETGRTSASTSTSTSTPTDANTDANTDADANGLSVITNRRCRHSRTASWASRLLQNAGFRWPSSRPLRGIDSPVTAYLAVQALGAMVWSASDALQRFRRPAPSRIKLRYSRNLRIENIHIPIQKVFESCLKNPRGLRSGDTRRDRRTFSPNTRRPPPQRSRISFGAAWSYRCGNRANLPWDTARCMAAGALSVFG